MPYVDPTLEEFRARFPIFDAYPDEQIQALLIEARPFADESWLERDRKPAQLYLTAHLLALDNSQEGDSVVIGGDQSSGIASESFGGMSISYAGSTTANSLLASAAYGSTIYGRRYLMLLRANKPAIVLV